MDCLALSAVTRKSPVEEEASEKKEDASLLFFRHVNLADYSNDELLDLKPDKLLLVNLVRVVVESTYHQGINEL